MKIFKKNENSYLIEINEENIFNISLSIMNSCLVIIATKECSSENKPSYSNYYSLEKLKSSDKKFSSFEKIEEVKEEIIKLIRKGKINFVIRNNYLILQLLYSSELSVNLVISKENKEKRDFDFYKRILLQTKPNLAEENFIEPQQQIRPKAGLVKLPSFRHVSCKSDALSGTHKISTQNNAFKYEVVKVVENNPNIETPKQFKVDKDNLLMNFENSPLTQKEEEKENDYLSVNKTELDLNFLVTFFKENLNEQTKVLFNELSKIQRALSNFLAHSTAQTQREKTKNTLEIERKSRFSFLSKSKEKKENNSNNNNNVFEKLKEIDAILEKKYPKKKDHKPSKTPDKTPPKREKKTLPPHNPYKDEQRTTIISYLQTLKNEVVMDFHSSSVRSICLTKDKRLACSYQNTIKIVNFKNYQCDITLEGHKKSVLFISLLDNGFLISSSSDTTIKIWDIYKATYQLIKTLSGHTGDVWRVTQLSGCRIGSCSGDGYIKIWSGKNYKCINSLKVSDDCISALVELSNKKFIVTGHYDGRIRFWDDTNYENKQNFVGIECANNNSIVESKKRLIIGGGSGIAVINLVDFETELFEIKDSGWFDCVISLKDGSILAGNDQGELYHLDMFEFKIIDIIEKAHDKGILLLMLFVDNRLISSSNDGFVKVWK